MFVGVPGESLNVHPCFGTQRADSCTAFSGVVFSGGLTSSVLFYPRPMQRPRLTMTGLRKAAALVRRLLLPVNCLYAANIRSLSAIRALKQLSSGIFSNENRQLFLDSPNARRSFSCCAVRDDFPAMRKKYSSLAIKGYSLTVTLSLCGN